MIEGILRKTDDLIVRKYRELFVPTLLSSIALYMGNILNGVIVGNLISLKAMAAIYACMPLNQLATAIAMMLSAGSTGMIAIASGAQENDKADRIFSSVLTMSFITAALTIIFLMPFTRELVTVLSAAEELHYEMAIYLSIFIVRIALMIMITVYRQLIKTEGLAKLVSRSSILQQFANVMLTFLFVGKFQLGVAGAGAALLISDILGGFYLLINYASNRDRTRRFINVLGDGLKKFFAQAVEILKAGFPAATLGILVAIKVWAIYRILGTLGGADAMIYYSLCMTCLTIVSILVVSCCDASMPIVGMIYGEKDFGSVRRMMMYMQKFAFMMLGAFVLIIWIFPDIILNVYAVPAQLREEASTALRIFSLSLLGTAFVGTMVYCYSTIQQRKIAAILSVVEGFAVVVPAAMILSTVFGVNGVWLAFLAAGLTGSTVIFYYGRSKGNDIFLIERRDPEVIYDVSFEVSEEKATQVSTEAIDALEAAGFSTIDATRVGVALEEMVMNIATLSVLRTANVDVRIKLSADGRIIIVVRDDGMPFNPLLYRSLDSEEPLMDEIEVLNALARDVKYNRVLGLNQTVIEI